MGGSHEWVTCPVCKYEGACLDFELQDKSTVLSCTRCSYNSEVDGRVFHFLYRKEFKITVLAEDLEEAYVKAQTGQWANVELTTEALHYDLLLSEEVRV